MDFLIEMYNSTGLVSLELGNVIMIFVGMLAIYLAIAKNYEPLLLLPIGFGVIMGNMPYMEGLPIGVYDTIANGNAQNSVFSFFYWCVKNGLFPPLIFLGIGTLTDFSALISSPKSLFLGAAAQIGIFATFLGALALGFDNMEAASIGIIGGADGPTSIFISSMLAPQILGPIAIAAYSYMALVPVIQPPFMKILTTKSEKLIRMKAPRRVSKIEKVIFPIVAFLISSLVAPGSITLVGMLMLGNLIKESGVTDRLAKSAGNALLDICTILLSFAVGASTQASTFLNADSLLIFGLGLASFCVATISGLLFGKLMNIILKLFGKDLINPLIGASGVSAVPDSARVVHHFGLEYDKKNFLLVHAMAPNVAGVIGSAIAAGVFISRYVG